MKDFFKFVVFSLVLVTADFAFAKPQVNSMCYVQSSANAQIQGDHRDSLFEIASVSKMVTSYWAVRTLGPNFRFNTRVHITPVGNKVFDVHVQGSKDPFWGRQMVHFLVAQLNRQGVSEIRKLTFDENVTLRWRVISETETSTNPSVDDIRDTLSNHLRHLSTEYPATLRESNKAGIALPAKLTLKLGTVGFLPSSDFKAETDTNTFSLKSAPLYRYLKEMNSSSNNHVADKIYDYLGGNESFKSFVKTDLQMDSSDISFVNGSGNFIKAGVDEKGAVIKEYNKASCDTLVQVIVHLRREMQKSRPLDLKDVLAVSGTDDSTLRPRYDSIPNTVVAKTGTVNPAVTLVGMISTAQGDVYFGILMKTAGPWEWDRARSAIRPKVFDLMNKFGGRKSFEYNRQAFVTFDEQSAFGAIPRPSGFGLSKP